MAEQGQVGQRATSTYLTDFSRAFVSSIPQDLPSDRLFSPASVAWRLHLSLGPVVAVRSLLLQALHPLAMAGVAEHSAWKSDLFGRAAATARYVLTVTYGSRTDAERAAERVRAIHGHVHGVDPVTGKPYSATDPHLLLWIHLGMVESYLECTDLFGEGLQAERADQYCAEMVAFAELVGIPASLVPATRTAVEETLESFRPELRFSEIVDDATTLLLHPPGLEEEASELWQDVGTAAVAALPAWARDLYGMTAHPIDPSYRTEVKQLLGAYDFALDMEPGVVEAKGRLEGWMRDAAP